MRGIILLGMLAIGWPALAEEPPADPPISWMVGDWYVGSVKDGCVSGITIRGTRMIIAANEQDSNQRLIFTNERWSTAAGKTYDLRLAIDQRTFDTTAVGFEDGFGFQVDGDITGLISAGNRIAVLRGKDVVEDIDLTGSADAMEKLRLCTGILRNRIAYAKQKADENAKKAAAEKAERDRVARIKPDPFAEPSPE